MYHLWSKKNSNKLNEHVEIWNRIKDHLGNYFDVEVIQEDKYKSAKINSFKDEIRTAFCDDELLVGETQCKAHLIILIILNTESTIVSKIFFILSKCLSFLRQEIGLTQAFLVSTIMYTKIYHFHQR